MTVEMMILAHYDEEKLVRQLMRYKKAALVDMIVMLTKQKLGRTTPKESL